MGTIKLKLGNKSIDNIDGVNVDIDKMLELTMEKTVDEGIIWYDKFIPERTGQVKKLFKERLRTSYVDKKGLHIAIGADLPYLKHLAQMDTSNVRHNNEIGYAYYNGHRGKILLNDPKAIGGFIPAAIQYLKSKMNSNYKSIYELFTIFSTGRKKTRTGGLQ